MSWKKSAIAAAALIFIALGAAAFYAVFFTTPRMRIQSSIRAFEARMPTAPADSVPVEEDFLVPLPEIHAGNLARADTTGNLARGKVYYGYYCTFCHGDNGRGEGPVGQSYMPRPTDLTTIDYSTVDDETLLRAMLTGTGHEPVINRIVRPEHYGYLLRYVRSLPQQETTAAVDNGGLGSNPIQRRQP